MVKVKICGLMALEDARMAADAGADMLGLNFYRPSPRYVTPRAARELCTQLRAALGEKCPLLVGVFVNETVGVISATLGEVGLDCAQLSGDESDAMLLELRGTAFKAIRPRDRAEALADAEYFGKHLPRSARAPTLLLDAYHPELYGGTGEAASVEVAQAVKEQTPRLMLAGGLTPENVGARVAAIQPWGVDVASGVEIDGQKGRKDAAKVRAFIAAARSDA